MGWVLPERVTAATGLSRDQLRGMCRRGLLQRGVHWAVVDRKLLYHGQAIQQWLDMQASAQLAVASRSDTRCEATSSRISSPQPQLTRPYRMRLGSVAN